MGVTVSRNGIIGVVTVNHPPINAISAAIRQGLMSAAESLDDEPGIKAVVLVCAGRTFMAGADVREFGAAPQLPHLPEVIDRIEQAAKPWIAAIHGTALGGGFEIAMGCRFRVASSSAKVGLPEVNLGIVPGAGGTVRTTRLAGPEIAVEMAMVGKPVTALRALETGLIDKLIDGSLLEGALAFAHEVINQPLPPPTFQRPVTAPADTFWDEHERALVKRMRGEIAPQRALACVRKGVEADFAEAMAFARATFLELRNSAQAAALRHLFFAERGALRPPEVEGITPHRLQHVGVVGGGTMGVGIAAALRDCGLPVTLIERDDAALQRGRANLKQIYDGVVKRGRITSEIAAERTGGVMFSTSYESLASVDLVIEAVFEDIDVKRQVFASLAAACRTDAVLATNTSYLDPRLIAEGLPGVERFIGLHFFSPAQVMKLMEIVPLAVTAPQVLATGFTLAKTLGKIPVLAGICDGFIGNRILKGSRIQVERLLLSGATPAQIDAAMRGFGQAMGPLEAQDLAGLDISAFQRKAARTRGETPFAPVAERLCAMGRFGQKSGGGWFDYAEGSRVAEASPVVSAQIAEASAENGLSQRSWSADEIIDMIVLPMINEGARILEDRVALRASDIDLVKVHGYGFPRWKGGPMHWGQARGLAEIVQTLDLLATQGLAAPPCALLRKSAMQGCFSSTV